MVEESFPPPLYSSLELGTVTSKDGEPFRMVLGLDQALVAQLRDRSLDIADVDIQAHTSDPQRFGTLESYEEWYRKERVAFALVQGSSGQLAALAWFGPKPLGRKSLRYLSAEERKAEGEQHEHDWHTIVYRTYPPFRGRGLVRAFVTKAVDMYMQHYPAAKLWAGIALDNSASIALAEKLGFKRREDLVDRSHGWLAMVRE